MISALDSKVMDINAAAMDVDTSSLMGRAGEAIADLISERYGGKRILFCCGHGNNGGDGFAAAGMLEDTEDITVAMIDPPSTIRSDAALSFYYALKKPTIPFNELDGEYDVLIDAGLGTGITGKVRPQYEEFIDFAGAFEGDVVSVDVPTGLGTDNAIVPKTTVVMHDVKEGCTEKECGEIIVADIGMPKEAYTHTGPGDMLRYPIPEDGSHKGDNGRLLVIGGGPYHGAPAMSAMAALRTGTDLVTLAVPDSCYHETASFSPVFVMKRLSGDVFCGKHVEELLKASESADAVLIGPGLGRNPDTEKAVREFVSACRKPMVVDADGLNSVGPGFVFPHKEVVLTPHHGEFMRLGGRDEDVRELASRVGCTVLLKGSEDRISDGIRMKYNGTGCSGMTGAGTGDVLAGIVAGLLSKGASAFDSACLGAYISGKAGSSAFSKMSYGMVATDVIDRIPRVLKKELRWNCSRFPDILH